MYDIIVFKKIGIWIAMALDDQKAPEICRLDNIPYYFSTAEEALFFSVSRSKRKALDRVIRKYKKHSQKLHSP